MAANQSTFLQALATALQQETLVSALLSKPRHSGITYNTISFNLVLLKEKTCCKIESKTATQAFTKNLSIAEAITLFETELNSSFFNAEVITTTQHFSLRSNAKKFCSVTVKNKSTAPIKLTHDHSKKRWLIPERDTFLQALGITTAQHAVRSEMQHKYKQINQYISLLAPVLEKAPMLAPLCIVDMGCGKGYLTFALASYLKKNNADAKIIGIEQRKELVAQCNAIAKEHSLTQLSFEQGEIKTAPLSSCNVLIALHACDTATDEAIQRGIAASAHTIVCAPCCHKQVRLAMSKKASTAPLIRHGILHERLAELLTDALRALWLEAHGYATRVMEFVDVQDTPKNIIIVATLSQKNEQQKNEALQQYEMLKQQYGIDYCAVEKGE